MSFREPSVLDRAAAAAAGGAGLRASCSGASAPRRRASATRRCCPGSPPRGRAGAGTCRRCCCCSRSARWSSRSRARSGRSPRRSAQATVMMVTDISGSMRANDVEPDRLSAAVEAGQDARRQAARRRCGSGSSSFSDYAEQTVAADHRPRPGQRRARPARRRRRHRDGRRAARAASSRARTPVAEPRRQRHAPAAGA